VPADIIGIGHGERLSSGERAANFRALVTLTQRAASESFR
jgi:hypothetical protein